jgi:Ser/Thr protein kinase RdoA (MazF antagonist)
MARLHEHTASWAPDRPNVLVVADRALHDLDDNFSGRNDLFDAAALDVLTRTRESVDANLRDLYSQSAPQLVHQDFHNSNIRVTEGHLAVLDFDDCGLGLPAQDLAVSAYYLRDNMRREAALLEGYSAVRPLPNCTADQFESLLAGRNLLLLNDILNISTADLREMIPRYAHNTVVKLRNWLDTGRYRHEVSGLAE